MIASIIRWSARNTVLVIIATVMATLAGLYSLTRIPVDAIPDLSDTQVVVYTDYPGQSPQVVEDQVTFPLTTALLSVPHSRVVRGFSFFGASFVYVIFEDGTDIYWARSRVLEFLSVASQRLPPSVKPNLGPDASGVGWVYQYILKSKDGDLASERTQQDWYVRFAAAKADGVAEIASVGGHVKQYAIVIDPLRLKALGLSLDDVRKAVQASNLDAGGRTIELSETEFMVRGQGYITGSRDIENISLRSSNGVPVLLADVARVEMVPDERRGVTEFNGEGEVTSGIAIQRQGANALDTIKSVKEKLAEFSSALPDGMEVVPVYDRSPLIYRAIETLARTLAEESLVVAGVCFIFLLHVRSAMVAIITLPAGILIAAAMMHLLGIGSNIMSLGGIAIAIGAMVDASIVMVENAHKRLERSGSAESRRDVIIKAAEEVGPALFFSLLVITVSFLPIFALESQEGRLFKPLAFTKSFAMASAAILSVTLVPALMVIFIRGHIVSETKNPLNRMLIWLYRPIIRIALKAKTLTILVALAALAATYIPAKRIGTEFMPNLNEGTLFYMPVTLPGISVTKATELLQIQNSIIKSFPEVESVWGKAGRALTATDPAPLEMFETIINLKPEQEWRAGTTTDTLVAELDQALQIPGVSNAWTMPIKARIDMLATGIRTPVGVKVFGKDLAEIERLSREVESVLRSVPGTTSAYAERVNSGYFLNIIPDRERIARYGLTIQDVQDTIGMAIGAEPLTTTVEGRERYSIVMRMPRDSRSDPAAIASDVLVTAPGGAAVPIGEVARIERAKGPSSIRSENGQLVTYVYVDVRGRDIGSYVEEARTKVNSEVDFPPGYYSKWSGQFEYLERAKAKLQIVIPATLLIIFLLLYINFRRLSDALIVMLSLPFALIGGLWLMDYMTFNQSVATVVGFIALAGVAAETGVVMLIYLQYAWAGKQTDAVAAGRAVSRQDLHDAIMEGAVGRVRPKVMTVAAIMAGLIPILWSHGTGSEIMQRIAVPMIGGMITSTVLTLLVIPVLFSIARMWEINRGQRRVRKNFDENAPYEGQRIQIEATP